MVYANKVHDNNICINYVWTCETEFASLLFVLKYTNLQINCVSYQFRNIWVVVPCVVIHNDDDDQSFNSYCYFYCYEQSIFQQRWHANWKLGNWILKRMNCLTKLHPHPIICIAKTEMLLLSSGPIVHLSMHYCSRYLLWLEYFIIVMLIKWSRKFKFPCKSAPINKMRIFLLKALFALGGCFKFMDFLVMVLMIYLSLKGVNNPKR